MAIIYRSALIAYFIYEIHTLTPMVIRRLASHAEDFGHFVSIFSNNDFDDIMPNI